MPYGCDSWTLTAETEHRIQAFEHESFGKILRISYKEHKTHASVKDRINMYASKQEQLLSVIQSRKLAWFRTCNSTVLLVKNDHSRDSLRFSKERLLEKDLDQYYYKTDMIHFFFFLPYCVLLREKNSGGLGAMMQPP
jgi:hypothetical protein